MYDRFQHCVGLLLSCCKFAHPDMAVNFAEEGQAFDLTRHLHTCSLPQSRNCRFDLLRHFECLRYWTYCRGSRANAFNQRVVRGDSIANKLSTEPTRVYLYHSFFYYILWKRRPVIDDTSRTTPFIKTNMCTIAYRLEQRLPPDAASPFCRGSRNSIEII